MLRIFDRKRARVSQDQIADRAYELWQARGCPEGDGNDDWQTAEAQLAVESSRPARQGIVRRMFSRSRQSECVHPTSA